MLKAHQACIDLEKNVLRIQNREVRFLSEHELPDKARVVNSGQELLAAAGPSTAGPSVASRSIPNPARPFPGGGHTVGSSPAGAARGGGPGRQAATQPAASRYAEKDIRVLMDLGVTREVAISTLDAAGGNLDVAASLLF
jgi:DNA damage-inducible protein 1